MRRLPSSNLVLVTCLAWTTACGDTQELPPGAEGAGVPQAVEQPAVRATAASSSAAIWSP